MFSMYNSASLSNEEADVASGPGLGPETSRLERWSKFDDELGTRRIFEVGWIVSCICILYLLYTVIYNL